MADAMMPVLPTATVDDAAADDDTPRAPGAHLGPLFTDDVSTVRDPTTTLPGGKTILQRRT